MTFLIMRSDGLYLDRAGDFGQLPDAMIFGASEAAAMVRVMRNASIIRVDSIRPRRRQAGFVLILEMLVVCAVLLVLAALAIPNLVQVRAGFNQTEARTRVLQVFNAQAATVICTSMPECVVNPALTALVPQPGTVQSSGYTFTFTDVDDAWSYVAAPVTPGVSGHAVYTATQSGVVCMNGGAPCSNN